MAVLNQYRVVKPEFETLKGFYTDALYRSKCDVLFEHVYECYAGENQSVFNNWSQHP